MKSRLVSTFLLWLLLLLAAAPASAVMDVQPRNHAWEPSASSYDLAPDVRDGPNLYAYVKQNPWTSFDPDGLAETAVTKAIKERSQLVVQAYESAGSEDGAAAQKAQFTRGQAVAGAMAKGLNEVVTNTPLGAANEALTGKDASGEPLSAVERIAVMAGFIPAGKFAGRLGKAGVDELSASAQEISKKADEIVDAIRKGGDGAAKTGDGTIYKVPGTATPSGKPYIERHNKPEPQRTRASTDGRDRTQAEVIDTYDTSKPMEGRVKEQAAIDAEGGVPNLDNKRNEIRKKK
ncbi:MAG: hypothetical protein CJBNEKGG_03363 [Prosthecobacter sp.]|nr:hypothetical protein [Prosthecobacter sp.]